MDELSIYQPFSLLYSQEKVTRYQPGGFHPVCLGDTFKDGRYKICHKLGWGGFSTVWLAWDQLSEMWVSIKVKCADSSKQCYELKALQILQDEAALNYIVRQLDDFMHEGPNGHHQCIVFELLGPSVEDIAEDYHSFGDTLEPDAILRITSQMLKAISYIHNRGLVHGDICGSNFAFTCPNLAYLSHEDLFEVLGSPEVEILIRKDGQALEAGIPTHLVKKAEWVDWIDEDEEDIRLIDFGEAFRQSSDPGILAQPPDLRAPETVFMDVVDFRIDLWRAGITIYSTVFGKRPFQHWGGVETLIPQVINLLGELPADWQQPWELMKVDTGYEAEKIAKMLKMRGQPELKKQFRDNVQDKELQSLLDVIRKLTRFRPSDRITAVEALKLIS